MRKIVSAKVGPMPRPVMEGGLHDPTPTVSVTFDDNETVTLFYFYPDEITFTESEFVGLTEREAHELRLKKDVAYLRS